MYLSPTLSFMCICLWMIVCEIRISWSIVSTPKYIFPFFFLFEVRFYFLKSNNKTDRFYFSEQISVTFFFLHKTMQCKKCFCLRVLVIGLSADTQVLSLRRWLFLTDILIENSLLCYSSRVDRQLCFSGFYNVFGWQNRSLPFFSRTAPTEMAVRDTPSLSRFANPRWLVLPAFLPFFIYLLLLLL